MTVVGLGTQIVECAKVAKLIDRHGEKFLHRVFTAGEIRHCRERTHTTEAYAATWAAKGAVFRSLGSRWHKGLSWHDVEIVRGGAMDHARVSGPSRELIETRGVSVILIATSHIRSFATATALAMGPSR
jgi:holo-[acyl-carrier protein] synthase